MDTPSTANLESLVPLVERMNLLLPVNDDVADGPPPYTGDEPQQLLQDARAIRDIFAQEKTQVENLLNLALEKVKLYRTLLSITEAKLCSVEDLIGDIRSRFRQRGIPIPANVTTSRSQAVDETVTGERSSENGCPPAPVTIH